MRSAEPEVDPSQVGAWAIFPFAALSASYFAHIGFFNPYLPLWLKELGLPIFTISLLTSAQSFTRVFAPYIWGALSDRTGERVRLLRYSAGVAVAASIGLFFPWGPGWLALVLLLLFTHTSSMMSLTEAAMAHLVAGDWGRYGRIRLWGSAGFLVTVFVAGAWFQHFGMRHFPGWAMLTLLLVLIATWRLPDAREPAAQHAAGHEPVMPILRHAAVRWFFLSLFLHVMAHFAVYAFLSLYLDSLGYSKETIGALWAVSVIVEIGWFFLQGRLIGRLPMTFWLIVCGLLTAARMFAIGSFAQVVMVLLIAQLLHAFTFATHHAACIALVSHYFPGRLRGRGQALFTVIGYGFGGTLGVLGGGWLAQQWGFAIVFWVAAGLGLLAAFASWQVYRWEHPASTNLQ